MILHAVNKPHPSAAFDRALDLVNAAPRQTALLLMESAVYQALATHPAADALRALLAQGVPVYALRTDVETRGLNDLMLAKLRLISDAEWVQLVADHDQTISWF